MPKDNIVRLSINAIELLGDVLERVKKGETVAVALVEVGADGGVGTTWSGGGHYHHLNSGAARLSARLATMGD